VSGNSADKIIIGRITGAFGVQGWVKVFSHTEPREGIGDYDPWYLKQGSKDWRQVKVEAAKSQAKTVIAKLEHVDDRDAAQLLTGSEIGIERKQLAKLQKDEYYWRDLIGLRVLDRHGAVLGEVDSLLETGANDVLVVRGEKEYLIPWSMGETVIAVNLKQGEVEVDWDADWSSDA
jgi:16S rRNA processing protein RimM